MGMSGGEVKTFWSGVIAAQNGQVMLVKKKDFCNIANVNFEEDYIGSTIMLDNGDTYEITNISFDNLGKITSIEVTKNNRTRIINCQYDEDGYLQSIGTIIINGIENLITNGGGNS
jgi:hypothetical protein